ncbi:type II toxin-antitoxin system PemK/MazF family toxin [Thermosynechococcus sp. HN-54]|uniref:type II toxin-antitoxin system PemK/MazF family toxin n=1 Tax=Thermosynechococcus sp. HN-54 TaxID=2933959 RepID=UPI0028F43E9E|nr:type II toxin-antitoxin system PemK/MazF family toxin [Thermosynechococcus sp. HN-54]
MTQTKRPILIVSIDIRNSYAATVLVVPFSTDLAASAGNPCRIHFPAGEGGLDHPCVAMCDLVTTVQKKYLERGSYGRITQELLRQVQQGIQIAIGVDISLFSAGSALKRRRLQNLNENPHQSLKILGNAVQD